MSDTAVNFSGEIKYVLRDGRTVLVELSPLVENFRYAVIRHDTHGWDEIIQPNGTFEKGMAVHGTAEFGGDAIMAKTVQRREPAPVV